MQSQDHLWIFLHNYKAQQDYIVLLLRGLGVDLFIEALASIYSSKQLRHETVPFMENNFKKTVTLTCSLFIHFVILNMISRIRR